MKYVHEGALVLGAFDDKGLVGIGVVLPHLRPRVAQLAYLHVSNGYRTLGIGRRLSDELEKPTRAPGFSILGTGVAMLSASA